MIKDGAALETFSTIGNGIARSVASHGETMEPLPK